jgi:hypothetical protein
VLAALLLLLGLAGVGLALADGSGPGVEVPRVEGLPRDEAVSRLESEGFLTEVRTGDGGGEAGTVTGQSPPGGERAPDGSTVTLTVAASTVSVPDLVGQAYADAEAELQGANLAVGSTYDVQSDTAEEGVVVEQGIEPGTEVEPQTPVNLGLSTGAGAPASASPASSPDASASQNPDASAPSEPSASASADASASPEADPQEGGEAGGPPNDGEGNESDPEAVGPPEGEAEGIGEGIGEGRQGGDEGQGRGRGRGRGGE